MSSRRALVADVAALLLFCALAVGMLWPLPANLPNHTVNIGVDDPLLFARFLDHYFHWLGGQRALFDIDFFHPHPNALITTDVSLGVLYVALPFLPFTRDLLTLVNLGIILSFALTAHATYLLVRDASGGWRGAGLVAGAAFGFCLYRFHQLDHSNILQMQWLAYALWALFRLQQRPSWGNAAWLALFVALHGSCSVNLALYSVFLLAAAGVWTLATAAREHRARFALLAIAAVVLAGAALTPIYAPYRLADAMMERTRQLAEIEGYSGRVEQLWAAPGYNKAYGEVAKRYLGAESLTFLGWSVIALGAIALLASAELPLRRRWQRALAAVVLVAAVGAVGQLALGDRTLALALVGVLFALSIGGRFWGMTRPASIAWFFGAVGLFYLYASLGPTVREKGVTLGPGIWAWLMELPAFGTVRTPSRFYFVTSLGAAVLAGIGAARLHTQLRQRPLQALFAVLATAAVLVEARSDPLPLRRMRTIAEAPGHYRWLAEQPGHNAVVELPASGPLERYRMYFGTIHGRPMVDGESGFLLPSHAIWMSHPNFLRGGAALHLERLRAAGLEFATLHLRQLDPRTQDRYRWNLAMAGGVLVHTHAGVEIWRFEVEDRVSPFSPAAASAALEVAPGAYAGAPLEVSVSLAARAEPVYEFRIRRLTLSVEGDGVDVRTEVYFAPPLLAAAAAESRRVSIPIPASDAPHVLRLRLEDEDGVEWASTTATVHTVAPERWRELEQTFSASGCSPSIAATYAEATDRRRWLVRVDAPAGDTWAGPALQQLRVDDAQTRARVATVPLPPLAGGSGTMVSVELPAQAKYEFSIGGADDRPSPTCAVDGRTAEERP